MVYDRTKFDQKEIIFLLKEKSRNMYLWRHETVSLKRSQLAGLFVSASVVHSYNAEL